MNKLFSIIVSWLPLGVAVTLICGIMYVTAQQNYRLNADDPQIQMAEDAAMALGHGLSANTVVGSNKVDMAASLSPFFIVFDQSGQAIASSAVLNGQTPTPPAGVFDYAKQHGQNRFTWQPQPGVRIATVLNYFSSETNGYILAGRSLREAEKRVDDLGAGVLLGWAVTMICALLAKGIARMSWFKNENNQKIKSVAGKK
jgi:hypothetical protein